MTMTSSRRVLKSGDVAAAAVIDIDPIQATPPTEPLLFTATETEALCETARQSGADEAMAGIGQILESISTTLEALTAQSPERQAHALRADSAVLVDTAVAIAEWVLGRELREPAAVADLVDQALVEHDVPQAQRIRVAPDLAEELGALLPGVDVVGDSDVAIGSFLIQTDGPDIGLQVGAALERARSALLETDVPENDSIEESA